MPRRVPEPPAHRTTLPRRGGLGLVALLFACAVAAPAAHATIADAQRGYELVSQPDIGAYRINVLDYTGPWNSPISAAGDVLYDTTITTGTTESADSTFRATRTADGSWRNDEVGVAQSVQRSENTPIGAATPDLRTVAMELSSFAPVPGQLLLPDAADAANGPVYYTNVLWHADGSPLTRLTQTAKARDRNGDSGGSNAADVHILLSDDGATAAFEDAASLTADVPTGLGVPQVYRRRAGVVTLVGKEPDGSLAPSGTALRGLSADGTTVMYEAQSPADSGATISDLVVNGPSGIRQVNRSRLAVPDPRDAQTALTSSALTPDGKLVYFTTAERLLPGDNDASIDLYRYTVATDNLALVSRGSGGAPGGNGDDCSLVPQSPDAFYAACDVSAPMLARSGEVAYFVSPELLDGAQGVADQAALYRAVGDGPPQFVASLPTVDPWILSTDPSRRTSFQVTAAGDLIFESVNPLTSAPTGGKTQVWRALRTGGALTCLSCRVTGGDPVGPTTLSLQNADGFVRGTAVDVSADLAGGAPSVTADGSTVFVNSYDRLVPQDTNAASDVYAIDVATRTPHLITTGTGSRDSYLAGIDPSGRNAYFVTTDSLDPRDQNGVATKLYDARIGGGGPATPAVPGCSGAACRELTPLPAAPGNASEGAAPEAPTSALFAERPDLAIAAITKRQRTDFARRGRLSVTLTGASPGAVVAVKIRVDLGGGRAVFARATSLGGAGKRTVVVKFTSAARRAIAAASRTKARSAAISAYGGAEARLSVTIVIPRATKGNA